MLAAVMRPGAGGPYPLGNKFGSIRAAMWPGRDRQETSVAALGQNVLVERVRRARIAPGRPDDYARGDRVTGALDWGLHSKLTHTCHHA